MILWMILAVMTVVAILVVLVPLRRQHSDIEPSEASDVAVYKDQLIEVEHDFDRGLLADTEAEAARTEIARRLLKAAGEEQSSKAMAEGKTGGFLRKLTAGFAIACIPGFSLGLYLMTGTPDLPSQPFAERKPVEAPKSVAQDDTTLQLIARAEEHLAKNPDDIRGWQILAPVYTKLRRFSDASFALKRVMALSSNDPKAVADYGESLIIGNRGEVNSQALEVFHNLLKTNPKMSRPLHYIALADAQAGRLKEAAAKWRTLLAANPQDTPWRADIERLADRAEGKEPPKVSLSSLPSLTPGVVRVPQGSQLPALSKEQLNNAQTMDAGSRQQMIAGMVKRLSDRLTEEGGSVGEWMKLARTQKVLGKNDAAKAALASAEAAYAGKPEALAQIKTARTQLGLEGSGNAVVNKPASSTATAQGSRLPTLSKEQMSEAGAMSVGDRQQMIASMVKRLSDRLAEEGGSVGEWIKLARTQKVLGKNDAAKAALASGEAAYAGKPDALEQLKNARTQLGIAP